MATEKTDAEKLADAIAGMHASVEAAKAARLPSVLATKAFFETPEAIAFKAGLDSLFVSNLDDVSGGCKRALERLQQTWTSAASTAVQRIAALQPASTEAVDPEPAPVAPAPAEA